MSALWANYIFLLDAHPLRTKALSAAIIAALGDVAAQLIEHRAKRRSEIRLDDIRGRNWAGRERENFRGFSWSPGRTLRLGFYGLAIGGPITHLWYLALERLYGPATSLKVSLAKMATDQVFAAPVFTGLFFGVNGLLERKRLEEIGAKLKRDLWSTLKANWAVWPLALIVNFFFVPLSLRVLYVNTLGLVWGSYLSIVQNRPAPDSKNGIAMHGLRQGKVRLSGDRELESGVDDG